MRCPRDRVASSSGEKRKLRCSNPLTASATPFPPRARTWAAPSPGITHPLPVTALVTGRCFRTTARLSMGPQPSLWRQKNLLRTEDDRTKSAGRTRFTHVDADDGYPESERAGGRRLRANGDANGARCRPTRMCGNVDGARHAGEGACARLRREY